MHRRELCASRLEANHFWECLSTYLPSRIPPPCLSTNPPPALVIRNLTSRPSVRTKLPQLQDKPSSHAAQNQQSSSRPIPIPPHRRKEKKKDKGKRKASPSPCSICKENDHHTDECQARTFSSDMIHPSSPTMLIDVSLDLASSELQYPPTRPSTPVTICFLSY